MMIMTDPELFLERCKAKGLSQNAVARRLHLSRSFVAMVRKGERRIQEADAKAISRLLGVAVSRMFTSAPTSRARQSSKEAELWNLHAS